MPTINRLEKMGMHRIIAGTIRGNCHQI